MTLLDQEALENTRRKLRLLESSYQAARQETSEGSHARELKLRSLKQLINQLHEEIARSESHHQAASN